MIFTNHTNLANLTNPLISRRRQAAGSQERIILSIHIKEIKHMDSKEIVRCLKLMANTLEDLEITNVISCRIGVELEMSIHLDKLIISGAEATWLKRDCNLYSWEKAYIYNEIKFFCLYTEQEYLQENK